MPEPPPITELLQRIGHGDSDSLDRLFDLVYDDLKRRAHYQLAGGDSPTLDTTALVHEAYVKLAHTSSSEWRDRVHFFRVAARAMRQIVVDRARAHLSQKRGGGAVVLPLQEFDDVADEPGLAAVTLLSLDRALSRLAEQSPRLAQVVELRFFSGLSVEETAAALDVSDRTIKRDWRLARAFLEDAMRTGADGDEPGSPGPG